MPFDRFLIAAVTDRLIYGSETVFDPDDARILLDALPHRKSPRWQIGISGKIPGGTTEGYAAGVGSSKVPDEKERTFEYSNAASAWSRAGQWKLLWFQRQGKQFVEIEQVMSDPTDEGRGAKIHYTGDGTPMSMDIRAVRTFRLLTISLVFPVWRHWKLPAPPAA